MEKTIVCYGDSNTYGYRASDGGRYGADIRWPRRLQTLLGDEYRVIEEGFNGRNICHDDPVEGGYKSGIQYMPPCMMTHNPIDLVIIALGINDTKSKFGLSAAMIGEAMMHFIRLLRVYAFNADGNNPKILLLCPPPLLDNIVNVRFGQFFGADSLEASKHLSEEYARVAKLTHCEFFDADGIAEVSPIDCLHYTAKGHLDLAEALAERITNILA